MAKELKALAVGHESGKYVKTAELGWAEINLATGEVVRQIPRRSFKEYDAKGNLVATHNIDFSALLEEGGPQALFGGRNVVEVNA